MEVNLYEFIRATKAFLPLLKVRRVTRPCQIEEEGWVSSMQYLKLKYPFLIQKGPYMCVMEQHHLSSESKLIDIASHLLFEFSFFGMSPQKYTRQASRCKPRIVTLNSNAGIVPGQPNASCTLGKEGRVDGLDFYSRNLSTPFFSRWTSLWIYALFVYLALKPISVCLPARLRRGQACVRRVDELLDI